MKGVLSVRHPRASGDPARSRRLGSWIPAFAGMTILVIALLFSSASFAQDSMPPAPYAYTQLDDPELEAQAVELMETLRCLKCQSQSIADSDVPMAGDMRHQVRVRLEQGQQPEEIRAWLMERYGDYVSYKPAVSSTTWPLFAIPAFLVLLALIVLGRRLARRGDDLSDDPSAEEAKDRAA